MFAFSSILAEYLQKFEFSVSQGIVATCLRWGGRFFSPKLLQLLGDFVRQTPYRRFAAGPHWGTSTSRPSGL